MYFGCMSLKFHGWAIFPDKTTWESSLEPLTINYVTINSVTNFIALLGNRVEQQ